MRMGGAGPVLVGAASTHVFFCQTAGCVLVLLERGSGLSVQKKGSWPAEDENGCVFLTLLAMWRACAGHRGIRQAWVSSSRT